LAQTFDDYELLLSDDSPSGSAARVIGTFRDRRIRVFSGPRRGLVANSAYLWSKATGEYVKYVYDDDFLLPWAIARLVDVMDSAPIASFAFVLRHLVNEDGSISHSSRLLKGDKPIGFRRKVVVENAFRGLQNFIGEPTSTLFRRSLLPNPAFAQSFEGYPIRHLIDMTMYLNALKAGPCIGVPEFLAAFRVHSQQASYENQPAFSPGAFEWEVLLRGEVACGRLDTKVAYEAVDVLEQFYEKHGGFPEVGLFRSGLPKLRQQLAAGERDVLTQEFRATWTEANAVLDARLKALTTAQQSTPERKRRRS
jgi:hypothetical protein